MGVFAVTSLGGDAPPSHRWRNVIAVCRQAPDTPGCGRLGHERTRTESWPWNLIRKVGRRIDIGFHTGDCNYSPQVTWKEEPRAVTVAVLDRCQSLIARARPTTALIARRFGSRDRSGIVVSYTREFLARQFTSGTAATIRAVPRRENRLDRTD